MSFSISKYADFGANEPWVARLFGFLELFDKLLLPEQTQIELKATFFDVVEEIGTAFLALENIRRLSNDQNATVLEVKKEGLSIFLCKWLVNS